MTVLEEMTAAVEAITQNQWSTRQGQVVPDPEDLRLGNDAVEFDRATVLYADLKGSTKMVDAEHWWLSAEIYKAFLHCAATIIKKEGGKITSYDGDRVMGIWVGDRQATPAAKAGLKINYAVKNIVVPALRRQYPHWAGTVKQVVGIDSSTIRAARTGVRGGNDIVWVGRAANHAAKLTELDLEPSTWITDEVFTRLADESKYGGAPPTLMWKPYTWNQQGNRRIHGSNWTWKV
ncbi:adenylate/guanylate cyclase domain-containing protein [Xanthomonas euvesicatoria]|uniref:adenylate/guanylate cyclase domain-containing protein n=1 Tax=Lysobacteraceae TaxID=32033 RepID=UPI000A97FFA1|nr:MULTISPECIES: adenylate/guanylate cyclase domain-containing protein [Xanthomonadaceae]MCC8514930.1 adenylate/guanylate cyclase domain-containing protein [Xanthomonas euvesicatoria pv. euvesicatoria]MCC8546628.1 adenylate/guanylate cyclase domain-containing protein [Xanthomonas euvesicatoria pv. euvesicatoria]MCC8583819.1 adenylate/guanylate cyclase domain-containing protein [Xanthomonas euvesicatoria pv. euvesicatoria]MCC8592112.1 adenylate/guanylate cyclase domain-containing protein [Xantho